MAHFPGKKLVAGIAVGAAASASLLVAPSAFAASSSHVPASASAASQPTDFYSSAAAYGVRNSQSVRNLQTLLIRKSYATQGLRSAGATGAYLNETRTSVKKLQTALGYRGSDADGILGKTSATRLGLTWKTNSTPSTPTPADPNPPSGVPALTPVQLKSVLYRAGFREPAIRTAWALVMRESRAYPAIVSPKNSNGTRDHGLFQINDVHRSHVNFARIYDPLFNAQVAYSFTNGGVDFSAWGLGNTGWAAQLHKLYPAYWNDLQQKMLAWRAQYPG